MTEDSYVIGVDYGTDSVRSLLINAQTGAEVKSAVFWYPRWKLGKYCNAVENQFRHHPKDYLEGLETTLHECLSQVPDEIRSQIKGIAIDTTGSTPAPTDNKGQVLALLPEYAENPNAMFILWKDHTGVKEAEQINQLAKTWGGPDLTQFEGGVYSSEWFWAKILHTLRADKEIRSKAYSWIELCDWIPAILTGITDPIKVKRSRCAAGHKAMWHPSWGGLPPEEFLIKLDPLLKGLRKNLYIETFTSDIPFGHLSSEWAKKLGLSTNVVVGVGAFDAHMGAIGAGIKAYSLVKIIGTSTCDVLVVPKSDIKEKTIQGICGQVDGSVIPNLIGLEAGQSGFGDVYAWFKNLLMWPISEFVQDSKLASQIEEKIVAQLTEKAKNLPLNSTSVLSLDWFNGRRTPNANQALKGAITGLNLGSDAPRIFRSLVEATAFGARAINECFEHQGIEIKEVIGIGGVAKKSEYVMQILADVLEKSIKVAASDQACALGAGMCAAVAAGLYDSIEKAQEKMSAGFSKTYNPNPAMAKHYRPIYEQYRQLGDYFEKTLKY